ncbi:hypothetical protein WR25_13890 [Diploscapter pachys]|uniref:WH2 domain-containing protein n=1 Tax=Diploscapter pachys TaxID=2018661 RepID=A0A2A2JCD5_9BILA|nr:hypothetical protein WR25_13890 [Diploscapter pachys]
MSEGVSQEIQTREFAWIIQKTNQFRLQQRPAPAPPTASVQQETAQLNSTANGHKKKKKDQVDKSFVEINQLIPTVPLQFESTETRKRKEAPKAPTEEKKDKEDERVSSQTQQKQRERQKDPDRDRQKEITKKDESPSSAPAKPPRKLSEDEKSAESGKRQGRRDTEESVSIPPEPSDMKQSYRYSSQENGGSISSRVCEVIHYSPHGSLRNPSLSPDPVSDLPHIERKSNIILNDSHRLKPIQVTHYDGQPRKKQAAPLPPVQIEHETESLTGSGLGSKKTIAPVIVTSQPDSQMTEEEEKDAELKKRYDELRGKFDVYQSLNDEEKKTDYARKLHFECVKEHDELRAMLMETMEEEGSLNYSSNSHKQRPTLNADTFAPKVPVVSRATLSISSYANAQPQFMPVKSNNMSSLPSSSPATSRADYPNLLASSYSSISPASSSVESTDAEMKDPKDYRKSASNGSITPTFDENSNEVARKRERVNGSSSNGTGSHSNMGNGFGQALGTNIDAKTYEKLRAIQRIKDEALQAKKRETELKANHTVVQVNYVSPEPVKAKNDLPPPPPPPSISISTSSSTPVIRHPYHRSAQSNGGSVPPSTPAPSPPKSTAHIPSVNVSKSPSTPQIDMSNVVRHTRHTSLEPMQERHPQMRESEKHQVPALHLNVDNYSYDKRQSPTKSLSSLHQSPPSPVPVASPLPPKSPRLLSSLRPSPTPISVKLSSIRSQSVDVPTFARTHQDLLRSSPSSSASPNTVTTTMTVNQKPPAAPVTPYANGLIVQNKKPYRGQANEYAVPLTPKKENHTLDRHDKLQQKQEHKEYPKVNVNGNGNGNRTNPLPSLAKTHVITIDTKGDRLEKKVSKEDNKTMNGTAPPVQQNGHGNRPPPIKEEHKQTNGLVSVENGYRYEKKPIKSPEIMRKEVRKDAPKLGVGGDVFKSGSLLSLKDSSSSHYSRNIDNPRPIHKRGNSNDILEKRHPPKEKTVKVLQVSTGKVPSTPPPIGDILPAGFRPQLRKVGMPVERNGISLGRVVDTPPQPSTSNPPSEVSSLSPSSSSDSYSMPSPPAAGKVPPAPPPPPPANLLTLNNRNSRNPENSSTADEPRKSQMPHQMQAQISLEELNAQKSRLKPAQPATERPAKLSQDMRDSLMEEIRNKRGIQGLKKVSSPIKTA